MAQPAEWQPETMDAAHVFNLNSAFTKDRATIKEKINAKVKGVGGGSIVKLLSLAPPSDDVCWHSLAEWGPVVRGG